MRMYFFRYLYRAVVQNLLIYPRKTDKSEMSEDSLQSNYTIDTTIDWCQAYSVNTIIIYIFKYGTHARGGIHPLNQLCMSPYKTNQIRLKVNFYWKSLYQGPSINKWLNAAFLSPAPLKLFGPKNKNLIIIEVTRFFVKRT